jgi:hypothetical protein
MSREPRNGYQAASDRLTIRLTKEERAALGRLVAAGGVGATASSVLVGLLNQAAPPRVVDAWPVLPLLERRASRWQPKHVWTPHIVPGTKSTLVVRRRVLGRGMHGDLVVELGRGGTFRLDAERLEEDGRAYAERWCGSERPAPAILAFDHVPTDDDDVGWYYGRWQWSRFVRQMRAKGMVSLWLTDVRAEFDGPAFQVRIDARWSECPDQRHELDLGPDGVVDAYHFCMCNGAILDGGARLEADPFDDVRLAELGASPWAATRRRVLRERGERARARRAEEQVRATNGLPTDVRDALKLLELAWPCEADDVRRAHRRAAARHHPDHGGDEVAMKQANAAAELLLAWLERRAA